MIDTFIESEKRPGVFVFEIPAIDYVGVSRQPFLDGCRRCIESGIDQNETAALRWRSDPNNESLMSHVGTAAALTVRDKGTDTPRFFKWQPYERQEAAE